MISLVGDTIDREDIDALAEWLKTYPRLTKGALTVEYEQKFSNWLGTKYSTFVNSGSSANLLMLSTLMEAGKLKVGDRVIVPALSWATDLAPVMQLGLEPILCDCNLEDFSVNLNDLERLMKSEKPKALILVSALGLVPDMFRIVKLCEFHDCLLLEDCCESLGSVFGGQKLGTFGEMSTFSTYFGHHMSTIEGGMVCTNNPKYDKIIKSIRSHGWCRDWTTEQIEEYQTEWGVDSFNLLYTFFYAGYNLRSTDFQAFIGLRQLNKLEFICNQRAKNFDDYQNMIGDIHRLKITRGVISNFAFPILIKDKAELAKKLMDANIECRPLISGSMGTQPFFVKRYGEEYLPNAEIVKKNGLYLPNHHLLKQTDIERICSVINS